MRDPEAVRERPLLSRHVENTTPPSPPSSGPRWRCRRSAHLKAQALLQPDKRLMPLFAVPAHKRNNLIWVLCPSDLQSSKQSARAQCLA